MIKAMGEIESKLIVFAMVFGANCYGAFHVDNQIAAPQWTFPGDRIIAETNHVGRAVFPEILAVGLRDAFIIYQYDTDFAPPIRRGRILQFAGQPVSQLFDLCCLNRMFFLLI